MSNVAKTEFLLVWNCWKSIILNFGDFEKCQINKFWSFWNVKKGRFLSFNIPINWFHVTILEFSHCVTVIIKWFQMDCLDMKHCSSQRTKNLISWAILIWFSRVNWIRSVRIKHIVIVDKQLKIISKSYFLPCPIKTQWKLHFDSTIRLHLVFGSSEYFWQSFFHDGRNCSFFASFTLPQLIVLGLLVRFRFCPK